MLLAVVGHAGDSGGGVECSLNHPRTPSVLASTLKLRYIVALVVPSFSSSFPSISPPLVSTWDHRTSVMGTTSLTPSLALACAFRDRSLLSRKRHRHRAPSFALGPPFASLSRRALCSSLPDYCGHGNTRGGKHPSVLTRLPGLELPFSSPFDTHCLRRHPASPCGLPALTPDAGVGHFGPCRLFDLTCYILCLGSRGDGTVLRFWKTLFPFIYFSVNRFLLISWH